MSNSSMPAGVRPVFCVWYATAMIFPQVSSELERMCACGRSVCTTTLGLRGSDTSTAVKFFGALSCAIHMMRRPSGAIWIDMPSPMPPKPSSSCWANSLKFQQTGSYFAASGLLSVNDMSGSLGSFFHHVMPGLVPGIHVFRTRYLKDVDGRDKPGQDEFRRIARFAYAPAFAHR